MKLVFIGLPTDAFSAAVFEVCAQFDPALLHIVPGGRSPRDPNLYKTAAMSLSWTGDMSELSDVLTAAQPDLLIVAGCPHRLPESVLRIPTRACFNVHPSLLPHYRGANPIFWQYQRGDLRAGVTVHEMAVRIDAGDIVCQRAFPITLGSPLNRTVPRYCALAAQLIRSALSQLRDKGTWRAVPQPTTDGLFYARTPRPEDFLPDWEHWSLERAWHFLRMSPGIADRALPRMSPTHRWRVGRFRTTPPIDGPGTITKSSRRYWINHVAGSIRLYREPVMKHTVPT